MKNFAFYDKDGNIKKIISTTRKDIAEKNLPKDHQYIKVPPNVKTNSHRIIGGKIVMHAIIKSKPAESVITVDSKSIITEEMVDNVKDVEDLKAILKRMIAPKTISFGKG